LSTAEPACYSTPEESGLRVETISFERIPNQSRLFLDYLEDPRRAAKVLSIGLFVSITSYRKEFPKYSLLTKLIEQRSATPLKHVIDVGVRVKRLLKTFNYCATRTASQLSQDSKQACSQGRSTRSTKHCQQ
jgi:hypothetical protein